MGVAFKITRNPVYVTLEQLYKTTLNYAHCATKIATAWAIAARDYYKLSLCGTYSSK